MEEYKSRIYVSETGKKYLIVKPKDLPKDVIEELLEGESAIEFPEELSPLEDLTSQIFVKIEYPPKQLEIPVEEEKPQIIDRPDDKITRTLNPGNYD
jgi:hypothetical protein